jgi:hypothetical protein
VKLVKNKVLVELSVPEIDEVYNLYLPVNRKIGNIIVLLNKSLFEFTNGAYKESSQRFLYNKKTGERYSVNSLLRETDIRNGSSIVLL